MTLAVILINLLPGLIGQLPGLSTKIKQLITAISGSVSALLGSGVVTGPSVSTALAAWLGILNVLKADSTLPASTLAALTQLEKAVSAALTEDAQAALAVDWTSISVAPITPVA